MGKVHKLKTWPGPFKEIKYGKKRFEYRKNDRNFKTNDMLELQEFIPEDEIWTDDTCFCNVDYILNGPLFGIKEGYCIMSLTLI